MDLVGRRTERDVVERRLEQARVGRSSALVVRGEAGIGKTALLEHGRAVADRTGFRLETTTAMEPEAQFAFAGLHQLCAPLLGHASVLPDPQRTALGVAFGQQDGPPPERFLVGLATLNLLGEVAEERPLLCVVDDAQWLDEASAQVLAFVARRVEAERLAMLFAVRDGDAVGRDPLVGLPELRLEGLAEAEARQLLTAALATPLDERIRDRIVAEADGNPLALTELPRSAPLMQLAGGFELPRVPSVPRRIEDSFRQRSTSLPDDTQLLLLVAAAEPTGDGALLWDAAARLDLDERAAGPAEAAGLLRIDARVRFHHPLVRSAVYGAATPAVTRRAHQALAEATDPVRDPDRRAWHRAQAVADVDEDVAGDLERSAGRARARGGVAAAAAFLERATELSPRPEDRARRAFEAAHAKHEAGASEAALGLLRVASSAPADALLAARQQLLRATIAFHDTRGSDVPELLLDAAEALGPLDAALAREAYAQALEAAFHAGRLARGRGLAQAAAAARDAPPPPGSPRPVDLLLDGLTTRFTLGYEASVPSLQRALVSLRERDDDADDRWLWLACHVAAMLWDDDTIHALARRAVRRARGTGALATLPAALNALASLLVLTGELGRAAELFAEEDAITRATGAPPLPNARLVLTAWYGRERETAAMYETMVADATARGEGATVGLAEVSLAYLHNGRGDHAAALAAATPPWEHDELAHSSVALPELIEAAVRSGQRERAVAAADQLSSRADASGTPWALGMAARSRALLSTGVAAEEQYREAIEHLGRCRMVTHLARAHLVFGEWLRHEGRRAEARGQLRTAHDLLADMGADAFAARAADELRAAGEHPRERAARSTDVLTAQELTVARLVATGATSREVGAQLFLSPRTIETHLRHIFRKLGITSRRQLRDVDLP